MHRFQILNDFTKKLHFEWVNELLFLVESYIQIPLSKNFKNTGFHYMISNRQIKNRVEPGNTFALELLLSPFTDFWLICFLLTSIQRTLVDANYVLWYPTNFSCWTFFLWDFSFWLCQFLTSFRFRYSCRSGFKEHLFCVFFLIRFDSSI